VQKILVKYLKGLWAIPCDASNLSNRQKENTYSPGFMHYQKKRVSLKVPCLGQVILQHSIYIYVIHNILHVSYIIRTYVCILCVNDNCIRHNHPAPQKKLLLRTFTLACLLQALATAYCFTLAMRRSSIILGPSLQVLVWVHLPRHGAIRGGIWCISQPAFC
jgi:hypothetical protein